MEAGQSPETFWDQTPLTYRAVMDGSVRREIVSAWQAARFAREERLRSLNHYLDELKPKRAQTADEMLAVLQCYADRGLLAMNEQPN